MKPLYFEKPSGTQDLLAPVLERKMQVADLMATYFKKWGYKEIETPILEFYETVGKAATTKDKNLFKLLDNRGNTLVLRPDLTAPIARVTASLMKEEALPLRLMYRGHVFRAPKEKSGKIEYAQIGAELIGLSNVEADAEVIALAINALKVAGVKGFKMAVGHMAFILGFLNHYVQDESIETELKELLMNRDYAAYRQLINNLSITDTARQKLLEIIALRGNYSILEKAKNICDNPEVIASLCQLQAISKIIEDYGLSEFVIYDLSILGKQNYYTGLIFEGFAAQISYPICNGGRYDNLMSNFERNAPATGFAISIEGVMEASILEAPVQSKPILILYSQNQRLQALNQSEDLRDMGETVITAKFEELDWWSAKDWKKIIHLK